MFLIKIAPKLCQAKISLSTHKNMHILLAFITNSPETKANRSQTNCKIVTQHLRDLLSASKNNYRVAVI